MTFTNFCGIYKWSYKIVVVQMRLLKRGKMLLNELNLASFIIKIIPLVLLNVIKLFIKTFKPHNIIQKFQIGGKSFGIQTKGEALTSTTIPEN